MEKLALISVSNKIGIVEFAKALIDNHNYKILSTGGTAKLLRDNAISVTDVSEHTGSPEIMEGRVKTLHPKLHGGLLCRRDKPDHLKQAKENNIGLIDLVVVNLYPFEETVSKQGVSFEDAIENIDIGGPSMLRSAAKNHDSVAVICDNEDYNRVLESLENESSLKKLRKELALKVFQRTASYDRAIAEYLNSQKDEPDLGEISGFPQNFTYANKLAKSLRYGENPHQQAALYGRFFDCYEQLQGKELSYNNILDITAATYLIGEFENPTLAILKHTNPCGVASLPNMADAWDQAFETDKQAPFGGIIVVNRTLDDELANKIREIFCEVIIAPEFTQEARAIFAKKKNLRLMISKEGQGPEALQELRTVVGGILVQDRDQRRVNHAACKVVTKRQPTEEEWNALIFGWKVVKHIKSNAIVYAASERTLGVGAGQMSRVDSSRIAVWKAGEAGLSLKNSIIASDAFFPFPDGLIAAAEAGAVAAIQPGGSVRDDEVIAAANERDMAMVFTGVRHFRH